jgi:RNA polymerase sigma-70 factor, ECF subfamily
MLEAKRQQRHKVTSGLAEAETVSLVRQAHAGNAEAFARLAAAHQAHLSRFCRKLMGDAAAGEDLAQESLLQAQQSIGRLGEPYRFGPWLFGIAANLAKKAWRAEARRPQSLETLMAEYPNVPWDESLASLPSPEQLSQKAEERRLLLAAIGGLPESLSRVVILHYLKGLNYAEVAGMLHVPISTVKGRLFESRARLRRELAANGMDGMCELPARTAKDQMGARRMTQKIDGKHIRIEVDLEGVLAEAFRFVTTPWPRQEPTDVLEDLKTPRNRFVPLQILEQMVLDGVRQRKHIAALLDYMVDEYKLTTWSEDQAPRRRDHTVAPSTRR